MKYEVMRGIESKDWRFEPGDVVTKKDIKGAPIQEWIDSGVLAELKDGNWKDASKVL